MRLWIDAQLSPALAPWLVRTFEVEARAVRDAGLQHAKDPELFERARSEAVVLVTKDAEFVELVRRRGAPPQVLWVTCGNTSNITLQAILLRTFPAARRSLEAGEALVEIGDARRRRTRTRRSGRRTDG